MPTIKRKSEPRPWIKKRKQHERRAVDNQKFYNSAAWRKMAKYKRSADPLCEPCQAANKITGAQMVDHLVRVDDGGAKYNYLNLASMCHKCHNKKSGHEAQGYKAPATENNGVLVCSDRQAVFNKINRCGQESSEGDRG